MIIDYDHNQNLNTDRKLDSLKESVQMALNENDAEHKGFRALFDKVSASFDKVNATIDSIKESITSILTTGSRSFSSNGTVVVRKQLNLVTVIYQGSAKAYTHSAYNTVFTLNADERPSTVVCFTAYDNNTADVTKIPLIGRIETNGNVNIWVYGNSASSVAPYFHVTYLR